MSIIGVIVSLTSVSPLLVVWRIFMADRERELL